jgi:hypothetical protein
VTYVFCIAVTRTEVTRVNLKVEAESSQAALDTVEHGENPQEPRKFRAVKTTTTAKITDVEKRS